MTCQSSEEKADKRVKGDIDEVVSPGSKLMKQEVQSEGKYTKRAIRLV